VPIGPYTKLKEINPIQIGNKQPKSYTEQLRLNCTNKIRTCSPTGSEAINTLAKSALATLLLALSPILVISAISADGTRVAIKYINSRQAPQNKIQKLISNTAEYIIAKKYQIASIVALTAIVGLGYANKEAILKAAKNTRIYRHFQPEQSFSSTNAVASRIFGGFVALLAITFGVIKLTKTDESEKKDGSGKVKDPIEKPQDSDSGQARVETDPDILLSDANKLKKRDPGSAAEILVKAAKAFENKGEKMKAANAYNASGKLFQTIKGKKIKAANAFNSAGELFKNINWQKQKTANAFNTAGQLFEELGENLKAFEAYIGAFEAFKSLISNKKNTTDAFKNAGRLLKSVKTENAEIEEKKRNAIKALITQFEKMKDFNLSEAIKIIAAYKEATKQV